MYLDALTLFSEDQAVTTSGASTSYMDLGIARNLGVGEPIYAVSVVTTALVGPTAVVVTLQGDTTTTFTPDASQTIGTFAQSAVAGTKLVSRVQPDLAAGYRYLQAYYTLTGTLTAGAISTFLTLTPQIDDLYANNRTIS